MFNYIKKYLVCIVIAFFRDTGQVQSIILVIIHFIWLVWMIALRPYKI